MREIFLLCQKYYQTEFSNHTELNLSRNRINSEKCPLGPGYYKVTKYILSANEIHEINLTAFSSKLQIKVLNNATCENGKELFNISATELCPVDSEIVTLIFTAPVLGFVFGILFALYYKF